MNEQNYQNHGRYVILWHFITGVAVIAVVVGSIINLVNSAKENLYSASLLVVAIADTCQYFLVCKSFCIEGTGQSYPCRRKFSSFYFDWEAT